MKIRVYISLGSNMGNKCRNLARARGYISALEGVNITGESSLYSTAPWGKTDQDEFVNQVLSIDTALTALELLHRLQEIEIKLGRQRTIHWGPRTIDLDILLYGEDIIQSEELKVPHPYMKQRLFVIVPLQELAPGLLFPDGTKIGEVLGSVVQDGKNSKITKLESKEESPADTPE